jgi:hypothetical protein
MRDIKSAAFKTVLNKSGLTRSVLAMHENIRPRLYQCEKSVDISHSKLPLFKMQVLELPELLWILVLNNLITNIDDRFGCFLYLSLHFLLYFGSMSLIILIKD